MGNKQPRGFHIFRRKGKKNVVEESSTSSEEVATLPRQLDSGGLASDNLQDEKQHCDPTRVSPEHGLISEQTVKETPKDDIQPSLTVYADVAQSEESEVSLCDIDNTIDQPAAHFDGPQAIPTGSTEDVGGGLSGTNTEAGANKLGPAKRRSRKKEQRHKRQQSK